MYAIEFHGIFFSCCARMFSYFSTVGKEIKMNSETEFFFRVGEQKRFSVKEDVVYSITCMKILVEKTGSVFLLKIQRGYAGSSLCNEGIFAYCDDGECQLEISVGKPLQMKLLKMALERNKLIVRNPLQYKVFEAMEVTDA